MPPQPNPQPFYLPPNPLPTFPPPTPTLRLAHRGPGEERDLSPRQSIVTVSVDATPTATTASSSGGNKFPVAVAIPALVGGMALALAAFGAWWWWGKRKAKKRQEAYERHQRFKRRRAESKAKEAASRGTSRRPSASDKVVSPSQEKEFIPAVPVLPKNARTADPYANQPQPQQPPHYAYGNGDGYNYHEQAQQMGYGLPPGGQQQQYQQAYEPQPSYEPEPEPLQQQQQQEESTSPTRDEKSTGRPSKSSKAATRMARAENAAANQFGDPHTRYQPKKPSPLALKAAAAAAAAAAAGERVEELAPRGHLGPGQVPGGRQVSGEWGVALGSPQDGSFEQQQQAVGGYYGSSGGGRKGTPEKSRYSNDPYLAGVHASEDRGKSGVYTEDPYAAYHESSAKGGKRGDWV